MPSPVWDSQCAIKRVHRWQEAFAFTLKLAGDAPADEEALERACAGKSDGMPGADVGVESLQLCLKLGRMRPSLGAIGSEG